MNWAAQQVAHPLGYFRPIPQVTIGGLFLQGLPELRLLNFVEQWWLARVTLALIPQGFRSQAVIASHQFIDPVPTVAGEGCYFGGGVVHGQ